MLFVLSKEIRAAKGETREKRGSVALWYSGGQTVFSSGQLREYVQAWQSNYCRIDEKNSS